MERKQAIKTSTVIRIKSRTYEKSPKFSTKIIVRGRDQNCTIFIPDALYLDLSYATFKFCNTFCCITVCIGGDTIEYFEKLKNTAIIVSQNGQFFCSFYF